jgi:hypothetical protein
MMKGIISGTFLFFLFACSLVSAATISVGSTMITGQGTEGTALISLDIADQGLSGYILSVYPENPQIVTITGASFPPWAALSETTPGEGAVYTLRALDLNETIGKGMQHVPLATLNLKSISSGTTRILVESRQIDDDGGNAIPVQVSAGTATVSDGEEQGFDLLLAPGWNFIAIPMTLQSGSHTAEIFKDVPSAGHSLFAYDPQSGWKTIGRTEVLTAMNAYWMYTEKQMTIRLRVQGRPTEPKQLSAGWSIIGIPGTNQLPAAQALATISDWTYGIGFDASLQQYKQPVIKGGSGQNSDQTPLVPGAGYWIYLPGPGQLVP